MGEVVSETGLFPEDVLKFEKFSLKLIHFLADRIVWWLALLTPVRLGPDSNPRQDMDACPPALSLLGITMATHFVLLYKWS